MPTSVLNTGIEWILLIQGLGDWLIGVMNFFSFLGTEDFYFLVVPVVLWSFDNRLGVRIGIYLLTTSALNNFLKIAFTDPRPYWYDSRVHLWSTGETSFGLPSGHAQNAVVLWNGLAANLRKKWFWVIATFVAFMIGLSRIYVAVHFPTDVFVGWAIGILLLVLLLVIEKPVVTWFNKFNFRSQILIVFAASMLTIVVVAVTRQIASSAFAVPQEWIDRAIVFDSEAPIHPYALSGIITIAGTMFGLLSGLLIFNQDGWLDARGPAVKRGLRFLVGVVGVLVFWQGLGALVDLIAVDESLLGYILRYARYSLVGAWITWWGPLLFIKLGLANRE